MTEINFQNELSQIEVVSFNNTSPPGAPALTT